VPGAWVRVPGTALISKRKKGKKKGFAEKEEEEESEVKRGKNSLSEYTGQRGGETLDKCKLRDASQSNNRWKDLGRGVD